MRWVEVKWLYVERKQSKWQATMQRPREVVYRGTVFMPIIITDYKFPRQEEPRNIDHADHRGHKDLNGQTILSQWMAGLRFVCTCCKAFEDLREISYCQLRLPSLHRTLSDVHFTPKWTDNVLFLEDRKICLHPLICHKKYTIRWHVRMTWGQFWPDKPVAVLHYAHNTLYLNSMKGIISA